MTLELTVSVVLMLAIYQLIKQHNLLIFEVLSIELEDIVDQILLDLVVILKILQM